MILLLWLSPIPTPFLPLASTPLYINLYPSPSCRALLPFHHVSWTHKMSNFVLSIISASSLPLTVIVPMRPNLDNRFLSSSFSSVFAVATRETQRRPCPFTGCTGLRARFSVASIFQGFGLEWGVSRRECHSCPATLRIYKGLWASFQLGWLAPINGCICFSIEEYLSNFHGKLCLLVFYEMAICS